MNKTRRYYMAQNSELTAKLNACGHESRVSIRAKLATARKEQEVLLAQVAKLEGEIKTLQTKVA